MICTSNATTPTRSPTTSATAPMAAAASTAESRRVRSSRGAPMSRPQSSRQITSRSCSIRYWFTIGRPVLDVASQFTCRTSSPSTYSRMASKTVPSPSGPRMRRPSVRKSPCRTSAAMRRAAGMSGYTLNAWLFPTECVHRASPSGPVTRVATGGSSWWPRRSGVTSPSRPASEIEGSTRRSGVLGWRTRVRPARRRTVISIGAATPRESTSATVRSTIGAVLTCHASTTAATRTSPAITNTTAGGNTSPKSATSPRMRAVRGVGATGYRGTGVAANTAVIASDGKYSSICASGRITKRWVSTNGAIVETSSGITKSRPLALAVNLAAACR